MFIQKFTTFAVGCCVLLLTGVHFALPIDEDLALYVKSQFIDDVVSKVGLGKLEARKKLRPLRLKSTNGMSNTKLLELRALAMAAEDFSKAAAYTERLVKVVEDKEQLKQLQLELADLYFVAGWLKKAKEAYSYYILFYPGCPNSNYASFKLILCMYELLPSFDRDPTNAVDLLKKTEQYIALGGGAQQYVPVVVMVRDKCRKILYDHEIDVINFYLSRGDYLAVQQRLSEIRKKNYEEAVPGCNIHLLLLDVELCLKKARIPYRHTRDEYSLGLVEPERALKLALEERTRREVVLRKIEDEIKSFKSSQGPLSRRKTIKLAKLEQMKKVAENRYESAKMAADEISKIRDMIESDGGPSYIDQVTKIFSSRRSRIF